MRSFVVAAALLSSAVLMLSMTLRNDARADVLEVRADGTGEFPTIRAAIIAAQPGDTVSLADGTYSGPDNMNLNFMGKPILVCSQSGDPTRCVLDLKAPEDPRGNVERRGFTFNGGEDVRSVLRGLTMRNGQVTGLYCDTIGAGVFCDNSSSPLIQNCILHDNLAGNGGAIASTAGSSPTVVDCVFRDNTTHMGVGGAVYAGPGSAHYLRCQFFNNTSIVGGAIVCHSEGLKFQDCLFERNSADDGAVILTHSGNPVFLHCTFRGNLGETSGGILEADGGTTNFVDCTFFRNVSRHGGIANVEVAGGVRFSGCTIYQNRALYALMRIVGTGSVLSMDHTIIAGSPDGAPIWCSAGASTSIACCDLYDNHDGDWIYCAGPQFDGLTNVSVDPRFCDPDNGNFHVEPMSWCAPWNNPGCGLVGAWNVGCTVDAPEGDQQALSQAVRVLPNPSHGSCRIEWSGLAAEGVSVAIYDPAGRLVRRLDDLPDGLSSVMWNARDDSGRRLPSGIYMVRIFGVGVNETGRFVLD